MRFLFALLIACLTMPALAAPHCTPAPAAGVTSHEAHHGDPKPAHEPGQMMRSHDCIGCIAPIDGLKRPVLALRPAAPVLHMARTGQGHDGLTPQPATPPPKSRA